MTRRLTIFCVLLAGCGSRGSLTGQVTYQGKMVRHGSVVALGSDKVPRTTAINDGAYAFAELPTGKVVFTVQSPNPDDARVLPRKPGEGPPPERRPWFPLPERYASFEESGLSFELRSGVNRFDIVLE